MHLVDFGGFPSSDWILTQNDQKRMTCGYSYFKIPPFLPTRSGHRLGTPGLSRGVGKACTSFAAELWHVSLQHALDPVWSLLGTLKLLLFPQSSWLPPWNHVTCWYGGHNSSEPCLKKQEAPESSLIYFHDGRINAHVVEGYHELAIEAVQDQDWWHLLQDQGNGYRVHMRSPQVPRPNKGIVGTRLDHT